jgi:hypothetical protein
VSTERDITGTVQSWLKEDAHEDADRVMFAVLQELDRLPQRRAPWSVRRLLAWPSSPRLVVAAAAVIVVVALGFAFIRPNIGVPVPSVSPSAAPSLELAPSATPLPALSQTFTSAIHGYSISYPAGWTVRPATEPRPAGFVHLDAGTDNAVTDHFDTTATDVLAVTSQLIPDGNTYEDWLIGFRAFVGTETGCAIPSVGSWSHVTVGGRPGLKWGTGGCIFGGGVVVADGSRVYMFGATTRLNNFVPGDDLANFLAPDVFEAILATLQFDPASAVNAP